MSPQALLGENWGEGQAISSAALCEFFGKYSLPVGFTRETGFLGQSEFEKVFHRCRSSPGSKNQEIIESRNQEAGKRC